MYKFIPFAPLPTPHRAGILFLFQSFHINTPMCIVRFLTYIYLYQSLYTYIHVWSIAHFKLHVLLAKLNWNLSPITLSLSLQSWFLYVSFVYLLVCFFSSVIMVINYPCAVRFFGAAAQAWILVHSILEKCYVIQYTLLHKISNHQDINTEFITLVYTIHTTNCEFMTLVYMSFHANVVNLWTGIINPYRNVMNFHHTNDINPKRSGGAYHTNPTKNAYCSISQFTTFSSDCLSCTCWYEILSWASNCTCIHEAFPFFRVRHNPLD